tara:strand:+ start:9923 stop:10981 length:1059 start_codon:yes stop_codon:yes gene_type:complete
VTSLFCWGIFIIYAIKNHQKIDIPKINTLKVTSLSSLTFGAIIILASTAILNYIFFKNPFYIISPPSFFKHLLPNALYINNYNSFQGLYNIQITQPLLKNIITVIYSGLGLEPIRYVMIKASEIIPLSKYISNFLNLIGPKVMMVSILSLSPFILIPFFNINQLAKSKNLLLLVYLSLWIYIWSSGFSFTRVILSCSIYLAILGLSNEGNYYRRDIISLKRYYIIRSLYLYGLITIFAFTFWSVSSLSDLPIKGLVDYNRKDLTRGYIEVKNQVLHQSQIVPSKSFEKQWEYISKTHSNPVLINPPSQFRYFMDRGIITSPPKVKSIKKEITCFQLDKVQNIKETLCQVNPK